MNRISILVLFIFSSLFLNGQTELKDSLSHIFSRVSEIEDSQKANDVKFENEIKPALSVAKKVDNYLSFKGFFIGLLGLVIAVFGIYFGLLKILKPFLETKLKNALTKDVEEKEKILEECKKKVEEKA